MTRKFFAVALMAISQASDIIYRPDVDVDLYQVSSDEFPMVFTYGCGGTMISPQMALTAAHCMDNEDPTDFTITLNSGIEYGVREIRTNDCWDFEKGGPFSADIAILVLDEPIEDAVEGIDYVNIWNADDMDSVEGREFVLAGWGLSGEVKEDGS